jgi:polysaccharide export outer membrane protein
LWHRSGCVCAIEQTNDDEGLVPFLDARVRGAAATWVSAAPADYVLAPQDLVLLQVFRQPDLKVEQRVDASGQITVPLVGNMKIAGMTTREAEAQLAKAFIEGEFLRDPQVSLSIVEYAPRGVSVIGEVKQPALCNSTSNAA